MWGDGVPAIEGIGVGIGSRTHAPWCEVLYSKTA